MRFISGIATRSMIVIVNQDPHRPLLLVVLPHQPAIDEHIAVIQLQAFARQPHHPLDVRFRRLGRIAEDDDLPPLRRPVDVRLLIHQQLVAVIPRHLAQIDPGLPAVGTDCPVASAGQLVGVVGVVRVIGDAKRELGLTAGTFHPLVKPEQAGGHRAGRDHVTFRGEGAEEQHGDEQ